MVTFSFMFSRYLEKSRSEDRRRRKSQSQKERSQLSANEERRWPGFEDPHADPKVFF